LGIFCPGGFILTGEHVEIWRSVGIMPLVPGAQDNGQQFAISVARKNRSILVPWWIYHDLALFNPIYLP